ncbi:hypothetical protein GGI24_001785, partial [Coemansia furcata]
ELILRLDQWGIFDGSVFKVLRNSQYSGHSFPNVRLLALIFVHGKPHHTTKAEAAKIGSNITAFVEFLWEMAPAITEIKLPGDFFFGQVRKTDKQHFIGVMSQLYQYYNCIAQRGEYVNEFTSIPEANICDLVQLDCMFGDITRSRGHICEISTNHLVQLARQSAATLQSLIANVGKVKDISDIVLEPSGGYVEYPSLHTLKLHGQLNVSNTGARVGQRPSQVTADMAQRQVFPGAKPFPVLRLLSVDIDYPFSDDTLFRGNFATLERLDLKVYPATLDIIRKHSVFTTDSHPKLQLVAINWALDSRGLGFASAEEQMRFVLGIAPHASVRKIYGQLPHQTLPLFYDFASIRLLSLRDTTVEFWDVIALIKSLPLLSDLRTSTPSFGPKPAGVKLNRLPSYMIETYAPLSMRFGCWYFEGRGNAKDMAKCVLLLALICPKFRYINPAYYRDCDFMAAMRKFYNKPGFEPHAARLWPFASK